MSIKKDDSGKRWVEVELEVPGTPEEVWQAIATGPGVSAWFVPTELREDGSVVSHFGPGMDAVARQTAWDPPHRFAAEGEPIAEGGPKMGTEWIVEARDGGKCIVRVVHSLFASTDDWDNQLEQFESGWPWFFQILRLYLTHFRAQPFKAFRVMNMTPRPGVEAWNALAGPLGLLDAKHSEHRSSQVDDLKLAGIVERTGGGGHPNALMLRLDQPSPGVLSMFTHEMGGQTLIVMDFYFYGDQAAATALRDEPKWTRWITELFGVTNEPVRPC